MVCLLVFMLICKEKKPKTAVSCTQGTSRAIACTANCFCWTTPFHISISRWSGKSGMIGLSYSKANAMHVLVRVSVSECVCCMD